jgi:N6-adenosine-specific RNA methylase IME4
MSDNIANYFCISRKTLEKETEIVEAAGENPKQFGHFLEKIDSGVTSVDYVYQMVKRSKDHKNTPKLPEGEFDIILADPPWSYDVMMRGAPDNHYAVMTDEQIQQLKIPAAENCILFLWATATRLPEAIKVMESWGFTHKTNRVWVKDKIGNGYIVRGQHELLLIGKKGDMPLPQEKDRPSSVIMGPRKEHSEKPDSFYQDIEQMYPNRTYLELFARNKRQGWTSWGNELE